VEYKERILPKPYHINPETLGDMLFICDFIFTFKDLLQIRRFGVDTLYQALNTPHENKIIKEMHIGLIKPLVSKMIKKENSDKKHNRGLSYLLCRSQKLVSLEDTMDTSYLALLESVLLSGLWNELIEESPVD